LVVVAIYWLGRRWFGEISGFASGILFAIGGFGIAFSRIIQYQSLVMFWSILALVTAQRYRDEGHSLYLWLTAIFLSGGLLSHYDAILFFPAAAWMVFGRINKDKMVRWRHWILAVAIGFILLGAFFIPYALNPSFGQTFNYLVSERVATGSSAGLLNLNWFAVWQMATFYNSIWYVIALVVLVALALWKITKSKRNFAAVLYFAVPFLFYTLIVGDPRTHVYTIFPGATILAGYGINQIFSGFQKYESRKVTVFAGSLGLIFLIITAAYPFLLFVDVTPERQRNWEINRPLPALYPTTWDEPPLYGLFGFPHQAGWRIVSDLISNDDLPYASNEESEITDWYMSQAERTFCPDFSSFIQVDNAQDPIPFNQETLKEKQLQMEITVGGEPTMEIFGSKFIEKVNSVVRTKVRRWVRPEEIAPQKYGGEHPVDIVLGNKVRLIGYDLRPQVVSPGGKIILTLYWEALKPFERNKQVFVHLYDGEMRAQHDGAPSCSQNPTTHWEVGEIIRDSHIIELPEDMPSGPMPILVGMYDLLNGVRMDVPGTVNNAIKLTRIEVVDF
jgi:hypothetical protein